MRLKDHLLYWLQTPFFHHSTGKPLTTSESIRVDNYIKQGLSPFSSEPLPFNTVNRLKSSNYSYDWYRIISRRDSKKGHWRFGDVTEALQEPTFVKSRPISTNNQNNILLPLDTNRHLTFYRDKRDFHGKNDCAIWRGAAYQKHRISFLEATSSIGSCNVASIHHRGKHFWSKPPGWMSIQKQLCNKFIFAIEGNDVASNLKWVMGSNSIAIMPKPKYETWFCESFLEPGRHYIEIAEDFSDVEDVLEHYLNNPKVCKEILDEAHLFVSPFRDLTREFQIARQVVERYVEAVQ